MSRSTIATILMVLMVAVMLAAIGCSSSAPATTPAKPADKPAATTPATTPAKPAEQPAAAAPAAPATSYKATIYTDDKYGYSIAHPKDWKQQELQTGEGIFYVYNAKPIAGLPNFYVSVYPTTNAEEISKISAKLYKDLGGTDLNYAKPEKMTVDGIEGTLNKLNWNYPGGYNLDTYSVMFVKGDKSYAMAITVMADGINPDLVKEIFSTFKFKK